MAVALVVGEASCVSGSGWRENGPLCVSSRALRGTKYFSVKGCISDVVPFCKRTFGAPGCIEISSYIQVRRSESEREKVKLCSLVIGVVVVDVVVVVVLLPQ